MTSWVKMRSVRCICSVESRPPGFSSATMPSRPKLVLQLADALDQAGRRAEGHARLQDVLVRQRRDLVGDHLTPRRGARVRAAQARPHQIEVPAEEAGDVLPRLLDGLPLRLRGVDRDAQVGAASPGMAGLHPGPPVRIEVPAQRRHVVVAQADEDVQPEPRHLEERLLRVGGHAHGRMR